MQDLQSQENDMQIKCVTIDLGKKRRYDDLKVYSSAELLEIIKEKYDLEKYQLLSAPKQLAKHKGASMGEFVFGRFINTVNVTPVEQKKTTTAKTTTAKTTTAKTTTAKKTKTATSKAKRTAKSVAIEE